MIRYRGFLISDPEYLYLLIPLAIILFIILRKRYIKEEQRLFSSPGKKRFIFFMRILFFALLLLALAGPHIEKREQTANISQIKVLIDNSRSMELYSLKDLNRTLASLSKEGFTVSVETIGAEEHSSIGSAILNTIYPKENILLVSDGQNNFGPPLEDVSLFASSIGSRLYALNLETNENDAAVAIIGPSKVVAGTENEFIIELRSVGEVKKKTVSVYIDDKPELSQEYSEPIKLKKTFSSGTHVIKAVLDAQDHFSMNNVFYKTVSVYKKPSVFFLSKGDSPAKELFMPFYSLESGSSLPKELEDYYAIIMNNIDAQALLQEDIGRIESYVSEGNGLFAIGGKESYENGNYNSSLLSNILPVSVGKAAKKKDIINIAILFDTGTSAGQEISEGVSHFDVQKALVADILKGISQTNKVAVIEANYFLNTISGLSEIGPKRAQLINDISRLSPTGMSELRFAYQKAHEMVRLSSGSKNIIIITDGNLIPVDQKITLEYVKKAREDNIKTFIIGVGEKADENFLMSIKELGGGEYFRVAEKNRIKLYFGDPSEVSQDNLEMYVYDSNHFITKEIDDLGKIYGFNRVYPKPTARLLLTTSAGDPVLTIWNYGLGRVAALSTDDGSLWVPDILRQESSIAMTRTLNWVVEDPERKNNVIVTIPELRLGESSTITVRADAVPQEFGLIFYEMQKGLFRANYYPEESGITSLLGIPAAVNYKKEYLYLGMNKDIERILKISGGEMLENDPEDIRQKILSSKEIEETRKISLSWIFISAAIALYLLELLARRLYEIKQHQ